ncbi:MAG: phage tail protein, partial [Acidimicrobiales bacterium]
MRGAVTGLPTPHPLTGFLPAVFQEDPFTVAFTAGLDEVLAPALLALDNLEAYIDPWVAPEDFVEWLAGWVGLVLDENWPLERRRAVIASAVAGFRHRGTVAGLVAQIES